MNAIGGQSNVENLGEETRRSIPSRLASALRLKRHGSFLGALASRAETSYKNADPLHRFLDDKLTNHGEKQERSAGLPPSRTIGDIPFRQFWSLSISDYKDTYESVIYSNDGRVLADPIIIDLLYSGSPTEDEESSITVGRNLVVRNGEELRGSEIKALMSDLQNLL